MVLGMPDYFGVCLKWNAFVVVSFVVERRGSCLNGEISKGPRSTVSQIDHFSIETF